MFSGQIWWWRQLRISLVVPNVKFKLWISLWSTLWQFGFPLDPSDSIQKKPERFSLGLIRSSWTSRLGEHESFGCIIWCVASDTVYASCNLPTSVGVTAVRHTGTPTYQHTDSCWHRRSECHHLVYSRLIQSPYTVALSTMAMYPAVATNPAIEAHSNRLSHCVNPPNPLNSIWKSTRKLLIFGLFCFPFSCYLFSCLLLILLLVGRFLSKAYWCADQAAQFV